MRQVAVVLASWLSLCLPAAWSADAAAADYRRHVQAVFSKLGCNGGGCHGAVQGKNGFRLSLFGGNPEQDYDALLRQDGGRRLNLNEPEQSLLLLKATGQLPHLGGVRTTRSSAEYQILHRWLAAGATITAPAAGRVQELRIVPAEQTLATGGKLQLRIEARFSDGSAEDVTALCVYQSLQPAIASVDAVGLVQAHAPGAATIIVRYRDQPAMASIFVPQSSTVANAAVQPQNFIDRHVLAKLQKLQLPAAPLCDDATFLRRATLDVTGALPTPQEVRAFLADQAADKRPRKIDELLARPGHAAVWTLQFGDILKASDWGEFGSAYSLERDAPRFQAWLRARLDENLPYDQLVERILLATSREGRSLEAYGQEVLALQEGYAKERKDLELYRARKTPDLYWQRNNAAGLPGALQVAHAFLGLRLECAQCHRHPHDVWQQDDVLSFANFFMKVRPVSTRTDNSKNYPELAAAARKLDEEAKKLSARLKELRESNKIESKRSDELKKELSLLQKRVDVLATVSNRLVNGEIHIMAKAPFATVTSPLGTQSSKEYRLLGEKQPSVVADGEDPRQHVMKWLRRPDNPYFARALVNRVWAYYFGRGLVDPPDNLSPFNPASHPELLKELSDGFVQARYDLKWLHRTILQSRTYQQSSQASAASAADRAHYAYFYFRRLPAEVLVDALSQATGTSEKMGMERHHWPVEMKALDVPFLPENRYVTFMLEAFGKPKRNAVVQCDCQREPGVTMMQTLSVGNHPRIWEMVADKKGRVAALAKLGSEDERLDEIYLATLSRLPTESERQTCRAFLRDAADAQRGWQGILWSLLNTKDFLLQH